MSGMIDPFERCEEVTNSDTTELTNTSRTLYIPSNGDLKVTTVGGDTVTFIGLSAGAFIPGRFRQVWDTGTTVSGAIINCW